MKRIKFPNEGIVEIPGEEKYLVLKNVLPGQQVRAAVQRVRKGKAQGRLLEVCRKAPCEIEPPCPHSDIAGAVHIKIFLMRSSWSSRRDKSGR